MKRPLRITLISIFVIVIMIICLLVLRRQNSTADVRVNLIKTSMPQHKDFNAVAHFFGKARAKKKVIITALEAGTISSVNAADESFVKKGTIIFTLAGAELNASLNSTKAKIASLRRQIETARQALNRKQQAVRQKIASFDELDRAKTVSASLNIKLKEAVGRLAVLENAIHIESPIDGIFTQRKVGIGQKVEKADVLAEVIAPNDLRISAALFPPDDAQLQGRPAVIHTSGGEIITGLVSGVLPQRTFAGATEVWLESSDINRKLKAGEPVSGDILLAVHKKVLSVPENAIVRDEREKTYVFIKRGRGYRKQQVQSGLCSDGWVEILSGITSADEVVIEGAYELFYRDFNKVYKVAD